MSWALGVKISGTDELNLEEHLAVHDLLIKDHQLGAKVAKANRAFRVAHKL